MWTIPKTKASEQLQKEVEQFLHYGGKITQCESTLPKERGMYYNFQGNINIRNLLAQNPTLTETFKKKKYPYMYWYEYSQGYMLLRNKVYDSYFKKHET